MACSALCVTPIRSISLKAKGGKEGRTGDALGETAQLIRFFIQMRHGSQSITSLPVSLFKVWAGASRVSGKICRPICVFLPHIDSPRSLIIGGSMSPRSILGYIWVLHQWPRFDVTPRASSESLNNSGLNGLIEMESRHILLAKGVLAVWTGAIMIGCMRQSRAELVIATVIWLKCIQGCRNELLWCPEPVTTPLPPTPSLIPPFNFSPIAHL